jgi:DNA-directed RNA polymerase subunit RPC12/RpoP
MKCAYEFEFRVSRCFDCGRYWAVEADVYHSRMPCPRCGWKLIQGAEADAARAERVARACKAAMKRRAAR